MILGILILLFLNIALIGIGVACLRWLPLGKRIGGSEPRCAGCGYIAYGLPAPVCPECGSALDKPGAITTTGRRPPGRIARAVAWTFFCALAVAFPFLSLWAYFIEPSLPMVCDSHTTETFSQPASKAYRPHRTEGFDKRFACVNGGVK